jgi:hypothetical protein
MSVYTTAKLGETDNQILFNDYTEDPVYRVIARAPTRWQLRQQDLPVPFESGVNDFLTLIGESAYVISGKMYPSSERNYDLGIQKLRDVCSLELNQADAASDAGYVPYIWGDSFGDYSRQIFVKPLYVQLTESTQQGFVIPFTIYCKIKDPTIFGGTAKQATTQSADFSQTTGSAAYSFTYPVVFGSTLFAVSATAINEGSVPGYPASILVHGPVNTPRVTNVATGEYIEIAQNLTSSSDVLSIIYDKDTIAITLNGTSVIQYLSTDSTLFKLDPGENLIQLTGTSVSTAAYATVNYYNTYPLA